MPRFRPGTVDEDCWRGIVQQNEYNLPKRIDADAVVVDIGTHVGSFVRAAYDRGCRNIWSFEADPYNYDVARENVGHLEGVTLTNAAVGRSDDKFEPFVKFGGYVPFFDGRTNTGGGSVFADSGLHVKAIKFDDIISFLQIDLLKIDCEGSEWPILYTSDLSRVHAIVGEWHSIPEEVEAKLGLQHECTQFALATFLRSQGFNDVEVQPFNETHYHFHKQKIGLFRASR